LTRIYFQELRIKQISNASGVFSGQNLQVSWKHITKTNDGFGNLSGDKNITMFNRNVLIDPDFIDLLIKKRSKPANTR
jgi:hypothetical protein